MALHPRILDDVLRIFGNDDEFEMTAATGLLMMRFAHMTIPAMLELLDIGGIPPDHRRKLVELADHLMTFHLVCHFNEERVQASRDGDAPRAARSEQLAVTNLSLLEANRDAFNEGAAIFAGYAAAIQRRFFVVPDPDPVVVPDPVASDAPIRNFLTIVKNPADDEYCSICRSLCPGSKATKPAREPASEPSPDDTTTKLPCGHLHCTDCIAGWLKIKESCPVCRADPRTFKPSPDHKEGDAADSVIDLTDDDAATNSTASPISVGETVRVSRGKYRGRTGVVIGVSPTRRLRLRFPDGTTMPQCSIRPSQAQRA